MVVEGTPLRLRGETDKENQDGKPGADLDRKPAVLGTLALEAEPGRSGQAEHLESKTQESRQRPEQIGHMLITNEAAGNSKEQKKDLLVESPVEPASGKRVDTMNREELIRLGETIEIDGSDLRKIYESHLIGERGLRRLIAEHLRGGDLRKALRREVLEREMDFERDPAMRDANPPVLPSNDSSSSLDGLLKHADVELTDNSEQAAFVKARARYHAQQDNRQRHSQRRVIDVALIVLISILTLLVIILYLVRR